MRTEKVQGKIIFTMKDKLRSLGKRTLLIIIAALAGAAILASGFALGFKFGKIYPENITVTELSNTSSGQPSSVNFGTFWQAWDVVNKNYLRADKITTQDKVYGAIGGLVESLKDPYSIFLSPKDNEKFQEDVQGNFGGIGAEIGIKKNNIAIVAPLKGTPAAAAGLKAGDMVLAINSTSTEGMAVDEAVRLIRGPRGTKVTLTVMRDGWDKPKDFEIIRDIITVPTLDFSMKDGNIAYVQLYSFNANSGYFFYNAVNRSLAGGAKGVVLDLRNNPGGYLDVAVDLAGWFLHQDALIVKEEAKSGETESFRATGNGALAEFPVVVLINGGSASASEILAGALRDDRGVKLIGEKSFGKGTVQQLLPLADGSTIKLTIAHWVLPSGKILDNGGLEPDIEVKITDEDAQNKRDPQLDKALEILKSEISK